MITVALLLLGSALAFFIVAWRFADARARALEEEALLRDHRFEDYVELDETQVFVLPRDDA